MTPDEAKQEIIRLLETETGYPVQVEADSSLRPHASVRAATDALPVHFIRFNPKAGGALDYTIAYQCGFALRMCALPPDQRFDLGSGYRGRKEVDRVVNEHFKAKDIPSTRESREQIRDRMLNGLGAQLRSMPIGLRIDAWLLRDYPALAEQQWASNQRQLNENAMSLGPEARRIAPEKVFRANAAMNAAFASFWSRQRNDPLLVVPFKAAGFLEVGQELLKLWDDAPSTSASDRELIETWGRHLDILGWFEFIKRQP